MIKGGAADGSMVAQNMGKSGVILTLMGVQKLSVFQLKTLLRPCYLRSCDKYCRRRRLQRGQAACLEKCILENYILAPSPNIGGESFKVFDRNQINPSVVHGSFA